MKAFRELTKKDLIHTNINDYRCLTKYSNNVILTCEHATQNFHDYKLSDNDKKFVDTHWAYDIGALDIMKKIGKQTNLFSISTNFSRLLIDPNRLLLSKTLVRKYVEIDYELDINKNCDRDERINRFYTPYYSLLYEALNHINPKFICSIHSFTPYYEKNSFRDFDVGLLIKNENDVLSKILIDNFKKRKVNFRVNEPYTYNQEDFSFNSVVNYNFPDKSEGVLIEVRNDKAVDKDYSNFISDVISESLHKVI